jgi:hypothetical protein
MSARPCRETPENQNRPSGESNTGVLRSKIPKLNAQSALERRKPKAFARARDRSGILLPGLPGKRYKRIARFPVQGNLRLPWNGNAPKIKKLQLESGDGALKKPEDCPYAG